MALTLTSTEQPLLPPGEGAPRPGLVAQAVAGAKRRWLIATLVGLVVGGAAGAGYYYATPAKHTVTATLQISTVDPIVHDEQSAGRVRDLDYRKAQAALVRGRQVIHKALESRKVADAAMFRGQPDPAGWLETELKSSVSDGGQLRLSLAGESPTEVAAVLNAVTAAYLKVVVDAEKEARMVKSSELDTALADSENRVRKLRDELRSLATTLRTGDTQSLTARQQMVLARAAKLQSDLLEVESQLRTARQQADALKQKAEAAATNPLPKEAVDDALAADPLVRPAADQLSRAKLALDGSKGTVTPGTGGHTKLVDDVKAAETRLAEVEGQRREAVTKQVRESTMKGVAKAAADQAERVRVLQRQQVDLVKESDTAMTEVEKMTLGSFDLELKRGEIAEADGLMRKLRAEKERLALELQTYKPRVGVVVPADAANSKPTPSAVAAAVGLGVAGLLAGAFVVGLIESRRRLVTRELDLTLVTRARVIGNLPNVPGLDALPLATLGDPRNGVAAHHLLEAVRDVRAVVLAGRDGPPPQMVMVTSAGQGDGKTTVACLLALSLAQSGKRVLLVDGDLRNPRVAERLGVPPKAGFGDLLRGDPAVAVKRVGGSPLSVLTAGQPCGTVIEELTAERVRAVFAKLRDQYDHIVVDSSPTPLADGMVVGACVDAVVLVVRYGRTTEPAVRAACERMAAARLSFVGGIVNGLPLDRHWARSRYYAPVPHTPPVPLAVVPAAAPV